MLSTRSQAEGGPKAVRAPHQASPWEHELKLALPGDRLPPLLALVGALLEIDSRFPEATVTTIYYDTLDLALFDQKLNSDYLKSKVRLRWYEDNGVPQGDRTFLELKRRQGTMRSKLRLEAPLAAGAASALPLGASAVTSAPALLRSAGVTLADTLLPSISVAYRRRRYIEPFSGARVAVDSQIRTSRAHYRIGRSPRPMPLPTAVVEVKGGGPRLPPRLLPIVALGCRKASFSKYGMLLTRLLSDN